jgi:hypothetical protein
MRYKGLIARQIDNRTLHRRTGLEPHKSHKSVEMARVYRETTAKAGGLQGTVVQISVLQSSRMGRRGKGTEREEYAMGWAWAVCCVRERDKDGDMQSREKRGGATQSRVPLI